MTKPGLSDQLIERIRKDTMRGDDELRESLRNLGWLEQLPAIMDERGSILVGHRRIRLAGELGIRCVIRTVSFGEGDEADAGRVALALASNLGARPMTPADRKNVALYLYNEREWSLERIAKALRVGLSKIRRDLRDSPPATRRKDGEVQKQRSINAKPEDWALFKQKAEAEGKTAAEKLGELVRDPVIDPATLPKTAQERLAAALRQHQKRLDRQFEARVQEEHRRRLEDILPKLQAREREAHKAKAAYERLVSKRGLLSREGYRLVLSCLHPDSRANLSLEKLSEAFQLFKGLEATLVGEKSSAPAAPPIDWDAVRRTKNGAGAKA